MVKKQINTKYPKELFASYDDKTMVVSDTPSAVFGDVDGANTVEVAIYKFDRLAKVKRTVTVE